MERHLDWHAPHGECPRQLPEHSVVSMRAHAKGKAAELDEVPSSAWEFFAAKEMCLLGLAAVE